jgi:hypothetical protein
VGGLDKVLKSGHVAGTAGDLMKIGVPKEIKEQEHRVALLPSARIS